MPYVLCHEVHYLERGTISILDDKATLVEKAENWMMHIPKNQMKGNYCELYINREEQLYKKGYFILYLRCIVHTETERILRELHEGLHEGYAVSQERLHP